MSFLFFFFPAESRRNGVASGEKGDLPPSLPGRHGGRDWLRQGHRAMRILWSSQVQKLRPQRVRRFKSLFYALQTLFFLVEALVTVYITLLPN